MAGEPRIVRLYQPDREREKCALLLLLEAMATSGIAQTRAPQAKDGAV
jgi:hypothetical protein